MCWVGQQGGGGSRECGSPRPVRGALCEVSWRLLSWLLTERASSCQNYSNSYPCVLAGLLGPATEASATMLRFKEHWESYCACRAVQSPALQRMCSRSSLNTRVMESLARLAKESQWTLTPALAARVRIIFGGLCNEDILEDSLGKVRDCEYRDASSRVVRMFKAFEVPIVAEQLARWGREEVVAEPEAALPRRSGDMASLFQPRESDAMDFKGVMASGKLHDWDTFTPTTLRCVSAELELLRSLHFERVGEYGLVEEAWRAAFIPQHCFILHRDGASTSEAYYSLLATSAGVLGWPIVRVGDKHVRLADEGSRPRWRQVYSLENLYVLPATVRSPIHGWLQGRQMEAVGIFAEQSAPVEVLQLQAERGFGGVPEDSLQRMMKDMELELPDVGSAVGVPADIRMAYELAMAIAPGLDSQQLHDAVLARVNAETLGMESIMEDVLLDDSLSEVLRDQDKDEYKKLVQLREKTKQAKQQMSPAVISWVQKQGRTKKKGIKKPGLDNVQKAAERAVLTSEPGARRWWNSIRGDMRYIEQWRPSRGSVIQDDSNGRFFVGYPGHIRQSISWTRRGMDAAAVQALRKLWEWHTEATGQECPLPL